MGHIRSRSAFTPRFLFSDFVDLFLFGIAFATLKFSLNGITELPQGNEAVQGPFSLSMRIRGHPSRSMAKLDTVIGFVDLLTAFAGTANKLLF